MAADKDVPGADRAIQIETERTFEVPDQWDSPDLTGVASVTSVKGPTQFTQTATYLDSLDLTLLRARHTLRRRTGGADAGWHLKTPVDGDSRTEHHAPLGRSAARVPLELRAELTDLIKSKPLVPVAILKTVRDRRLLRDADGGVVAELVDDHTEATVLASVRLDGTEEVLRWREVELEAGPAADAEAYEALCAALEDGGLTRSDSPSKLARALAEPLARHAAQDAEGAEDAKGAAGAEGGEAVTVGRVVLDYLGAQLGVLQAREQDVRDDAYDAVHKARVATRRARSALRTFRDLFDREQTDPVRAELAWLTGVLGEARDAEVLRERLGELLDQLADEAGGRGSVLKNRHVRDARRRLLGMVEEDHRVGHKHSVKALDSRRYERLLGSLTELELNPPYRAGAGDRRPADAPAEEALPDYLRKAAARVTRAAEKARAAEQPERGEFLHDVRKDGKAARYAGEAAAPVLGSDAAKTPAWERVQDALGDLQDGLVTREVIGRAVAAARRAGEDTLVYGVLSERERGAAAAAEADAEEYLEEALQGAFAT